MINPNQKPGKITHQSGACSEGGQHEWTFDLWPNVQSNFEECWKCGSCPSLTAFNQQCDENNAKAECSICGGPRRHYGECK